MKHTSELLDKIRFKTGLLFKINDLSVLVCKRQRSREKQKEESSEERIREGQARNNFLSPFRILVVSGRISSFILYKIPKSGIIPQQDLSALEASV